MNQIEALRKIRALGVPGFETRDIAALLGVSPANRRCCSPGLPDAVWSAASPGVYGLRTTE